MKWALIFLVFALLAMTARSEKDIVVVSTNSSTKVVHISPSQWNAIKKELDSKGISKLPMENLVLEITNSNAKVDHVLVDGTPPIDFVGGGEGGGRNGDR